MDFLQKKLQAIFTQWRESGFLSVIYALLAEALLIGYLGFTALFTMETLLPTFVTARLSLAKFFAVLVLLSFALALLGRYLDIGFGWKTGKKNPLLWIGLLWTVAILAVSLYKFPIATIPVIIAGFLLVGFLFFRIFFSRQD